MYDPLFANAAINEKEMLKNLKRIGRENQLRVQKFNEMLDSLVKSKSMGSVALAAFNEQTSRIMERYEERLQQLMKSTKTKPASVVFDDSPYD